MGLGNSNSMSKILGIETRFDKFHQASSLVKGVPAIDYGGPPEKRSEAIEESASKRFICMVFVGS